MIFTNVRRLLSTFALVAVFFAISCKPDTPQDTTSVSGAISSRFLVPKTKSLDELVEIALDLGNSLARSPIRTGVGGTISTDPKELISAIYLKKLIDVGGLPRAQGVAIFRLLLAPDQTLCGGANCGRLLQLKQDDVESFFNALANAVETSPALKSPQRARDRTILRRSFTRPEPAELIREIGNEAKVYIPEFAPKPLNEILSREALTSKIKQQSLRAIRGYTGDDSGALRLMEAYSVQELEKKGFIKSFIDIKRDQLNNIRVVFANPTIPRVSATVYRGMHDVSAKDLGFYIYHLQTGEPIGLGPEHRKAMTSASWDPNVADRFVITRRLSQQYSVLFQIKNHDGIGIENISIAPHEREVLIPGNRKFTVMGVHLSEQRDNLYVVELDGNSH